MPDSPDNLVYLNYWKRKQLLKTVPAFAIRRHWWDVEELSEAHAVIYEAIRGADTVLDVGAGDMRFMRLACQRGFTKTYHTLDIGHEHEYTYADLKDVKRTYDAVVCMDVLEHLDLADGIGFLHRLLSVVAPGGVLALQTANANFHRHPLAWDMTHLHAYNPVDLWTYLTALGHATTMYRVRFGHPAAGLRERAHEWIRSWIAEELYLDYCENLLAIVRTSQSLPDRAIAAGASRVVQSRAEPDASR